MIVKRLHTSMISLKWIECGRADDLPNKDDQPGSSFHPRMDMPFIHIDDSPRLFFHIKRWTCLDATHDHSKLIIQAEQADHPQCGRTFMCKGSLSSRGGAISLKRGKKRKTLTRTSLITKSTRRYYFVKLLAHVHIRMYVQCIVTFFFCFLICKVTAFRVCKFTSKMSVWNRPLLGVTK